MPQFRCRKCKSVVDEEALLCSNPNCGYKRKLNNLRPLFIGTFCVVAIMHLILIWGNMPSQAWDYCLLEFHDKMAVTVVLGLMLLAICYVITLCVAGMAWICIVRPILMMFGSYESWLAVDSEEKPILSATPAVVHAEELPANVIPLEQ